MSETDDLVARPWVVAIALACFIIGVFIQQIFFAITLGPLIHNPSNGTNGTNGTNGNGNNQTTTPTSTPPIPVSHFDLIADPQTGAYFKKGYYEEGGQYYLRFFEITVRETGGSSGTVIIQCAVKDKYDNEYKQEFHESFNARQEKTLEFKIAISSTVWSNDEIVWSSATVKLIGEY